MTARSSTSQISSALAAYLRTNAVESMSYPMAVILGELGRLVPIFIYFFIAELVGDSPTVGGDYFTYVVIGLSVSAGLYGAMTSFTQNLQRAQNRGNLEILLVEPVSWSLVPHYMSAWHLLRAFVDSVIVLVAGLALGADIRVSGLPIFLVLVLAGMLASHAIGILAASLVVLSKRSAPLLQLYGLAASLLGGAVFSVDQLPSWLQLFSYAIPHTYVITASRTVLMSDPGTFAFAPETALAALGGFVAIILPLGLFAFIRSTGYAQRTGMLGGY